MEAYYDGLARLTPRRVTVRVDSIVSLFFSGQALGNALEIGLVFLAMWLGVFLWGPILKHIESGTYYCICDVILRTNYMLTGNLSCRTKETGQNSCVDLIGGLLQWPRTRDA